MKKLISSVMLACLVSTSALADCDFKTGIEKLPDGRFAYTPECHIKVGQMKQDLDTATQQVELYKKSIELKDLALGTAQTRIDLWQQTSFKLEDRVNAMEDLRSKNYVLYFGLGVLVTGLAVYGAGQLVHR